MGISQKKRRKLKREQNIFKNSSQKIKCRKKHRRPQRLQSPKRLKPLDHYLSTPLKLMESILEISRSFAKLDIIQWRALPMHPKRISWESREFPRPRLTKLWRRDKSWYPQDSPLLQKCI